MNLLGLVASAARNLPHTHTHNSQRPYRYTSTVAQGTKHTHPHSVDLMNACTPWPHQAIWTSIPSSYSKWKFRLSWGEDTLIMHNCLHGLYRTLYHVCMCPMLPPQSGSPPQCLHLTSYRCRLGMTFGLIHTYMYVCMYVWPDILLSMMFLSQQHTGRPISVSHI